MGEVEEGLGREFFPVIVFEWLIRPLPPHS